MTVGRKPLPTAVKVLTGNPGKRPLNDAEPMGGPLELLPDPPEWLGQYGEAEWYRTGPVLIHMGLLTEADVPLLETYCASFDLLIESRMDVKEHGMVIEGSRGPVRNPALAAIAQATTAIKGLAAEFGLTPSSRSRLKLPGDDGESIADILGIGGDEDVS